jgi:very-short-patch-repair endonuclease
MNKLYTITSLTWNITSEQISEIKYNRHSMLKNYTIYFVGLPPHLAVEISADVFEFFKESFPEHCISIKDSDYELPY